MQKKITSTLNRQNLPKLETIMCYIFENKELLLQAITHSSFANEHRNEEMGDNERLEFLGDAILDLIISEYLYKKYPKLPEGDLSKIRASIVCEASLAVAARKMGLGEFIHLGRGEELTGGRNRASILADTFEAVTGAMFLDGCFEDVRAFLERTLIAAVDHLPVEDLYTDYKTLLQESIQKESSVPLHYAVVDEKGPDHDKDFYVAVSHGDHCLGNGVGKSKKEAEQKAAKDALRSIQQSK